MRRRLAERWPRVLLGALALIGALSLAACGSDDDDDGGGGDTGNIEAQQVIRFAFAPDPVWNYIVDSGILEEKGTEAGIDINAFQSFDEFGLFAGGNADVLSTGSYETPLLDEQGIETVTFGRYNANKDIFAVAADNPAKTAKDLDEGCKVAAESPTGNTVIWASLVNELDGRTIEEGGDDLGLVTADYQVMPQLLEDGEVCAAIVDPFQATEALRTGQIKALYDGQPANALYAEAGLSDDPNELHVNSNNFVARKDWFDENTEAAAFFLDVWQEGMDQWIKDSDQIIHDNPEDFAVQSPEDEKFIQDYVDKSEFQYDSVYLTPEWVKGEEGVFDLIQDAGEINPDTTFPEHAIIDPKTGKVTQTIGGSE
jgi:ABC-type nitrate/sulfonate/bicarbonate transport system substrate-binding protein